MGLQMILKETAIATLITELHHTEMYAFHLMASGIEMSENVTKEGLTKIICVLCKKLEWIREECITISEDEESPDLIQTEKPTLVNEKSKYQSLVHESAAEVAILENSPKVMNESDTHNDMVEFKNKLFSYSQRFVKLSNRIRHERAHKIKNSIIEEVISETKPERRKQSDSTDPFNCSQCNKTFKKAAELKSHQIAHTNYRPFKCSTCNMKFKSAQHQKRHEIETHTDDKPFKCETCDVMFSRSFHLKRHKAIHSKAKQYPCSHCDQSFLRSDHLELHERLHNDKKPFSCPHCKMAFRRKHHLQDHEKKHTGERPYSCTLCNNTYIQKGALKKHLKSQHKKNFQTKNLSKI